MRILNKYKDDVGSSIYIGRGSPFGNPFVIGQHHSRVPVIYMYYRYLLDRIVSNDITLIHHIMQLDARDGIYCYCSPKPCHGQVIEWIQTLLKTYSLSEIQLHYPIYSASTEGIDHINISNNSNSKLGVRLANMLKEVTTQVGIPITDKHYYTEINSSLTSIIPTDKVISKLLASNHLPIRCYNLKGGKLNYPYFNYWLEYVLKDIEMLLTGGKNVIVAGSRTITDYPTVSKAIRESNINVGRMVSGTAKGPDLLGEKYATINNIPIVRFKPYWESGKGAGYHRNAEMAKYADVLIAIWDGKSKGTKHMVDIAEKHNLEVVICKP